MPISLAPRAKGLGLAVARVADGDDVLGQQRVLAVPRLVQVHRARRTVHAPPRTSLDPTGEQHLHDLLAAHGHASVQPTWPENLWCVPRGAGRVTRSQSLQARRPPLAGAASG